MYKLTMNTVIPRLLNLLNSLNFISRLTLWQFTFLIIIAFSIINTCFFFSLNFVPNNFFVPASDKVLLFASDAWAYLLSIQRAKYNSWESLITKENLYYFENLGWLAIKKIISPFFYECWSLTWISTSCQLVINIFFLYRIFQVFKVQKRFINYLILILLLLPSQYVWLLQPLKDGWFVSALLGYLYLIVSSVGERLKFPVIFFNLLLTPFIVLLISLIRPHMLFVLLPGSLLLSICLFLFFRQIANREFYLRSFLLFMLFFSQLIILKRNISDSANQIHSQSIAKTLSSNPNNMFTSGETQINILAFDTKIFKIMPQIFSEQLENLMSTRNAFISSFNNVTTSIDNVTILDPLEALLYLPKSLLIGLTVPFQIVASFDHRYPFLFILSKIEVLLCFLLFFMSLWVGITKKPILAFVLFSIAVFIVIPLTMLTFVMPVVGIILRQRFVFYYLADVLFLALIISTIFPKEAPNKAKMKLNQNSLFDRNFS